MIDLIEIDFFTKLAQGWWSKWIKDCHGNSVGFDGFRVDMNEPGNSGSLVLIFS